MGNTDEDPLAVNAHDGGAYNDFGSGDMPFPKDKYDAMRSAGVEVLHVPFALGAMAFFDNALYCVETTPRHRRGVGSMA